MTAESYSTDHTYTNKVQFSNSIFNYRTLDKKELSLVYDYPQIDGNGCQNHIVGTWYNVNDKILSSLLSILIIGMVSMDLVDK